MYYNEPKNPFKKAVDTILTVLNDNRDYFMKDPKNLSAMMKIYNEITYGGRAHPKELLDMFCNPKYPFEVFSEDEEFHDQVFDAWRYWVRYTEDFYRNGTVPKTELQMKMYKTPDEFVQMFLDKNYQYHKLFTSKWSVFNHLFNLYGTGLEWKDGYLVHKSNIEQKWANPPELPEDIMKKLTFLKSKVIQEGKKCYTDDVEKHHQSYRFLLDNLDRQPDPEKIIEELIEITRNNANGEDTTAVEAHFKSYLKKDIEVGKGPYDHIREFTPKYSPILTMPKNVHPSYVTAAIEWCEYLVTADVSKNLKKQAQEFLTENKKAS